MQASKQASKQPTFYQLCSIPSPFLFSWEVVSLRHPTVLSLSFAELQFNTLVPTVSENKISPPKIMLISSSLHKNQCL